MWEIPQFLFLFLLRSPVCVEFHQTGEIHQNSEDYKLERVKWVPGYYVTIYYVCQIVVRSFLDIYYVNPG